jgi:hypothetical protein
MSDDKKPFNLNMHTARLLMNEPFFAALSRRIEKSPTTAIPTAGVRVNPDTSQFELMYGIRRNWKLRKSKAKTMPAMVVVVSLNGPIRILLIHTMLSVMPRVLPARLQRSV